MAATKITITIKGDRSTVDTVINSIKFFATPAAGKWEADIVVEPIKEVVLDSFDYLEYLKEG